jgi:16S rRNA (guanine(527)-N(7))-methyltransferase RsmG
MLEEGVMQQTERDLNQMKVQESNTMDIQKKKKIIRSIVSRETICKFEIFIEMILKWNSKINMISRVMAKPDDVWERHVIDCIQLAKFLKPTDNIVDVGSGAGFPGLILGMMGLKVTLVETLNKRCAFLRAAVAELKLQDNVQIINDDVRKYKNENANIITARAWANAKDIMLYTRHLHNKGCKIILLKSKYQLFEFDEAKRVFSFKLQEFPNEYYTEGRIYILSDIKYLVK